MKQLKEKNKKILAIIIISLVIITGIIVTVLLGFNKELKYSETQSIDVYLEQEFDQSKIKDIANEILGKNNIVEVVEIYEDMATIRAKNISEEQKNNLVNKIKENYEFEQTAEETTIKNVPAARLIDMYKNYIIPFAISGIIVLVYMLIRYRKKGIIKVLINTIFIPIITILLLLSLISMTRIPVGRFIPIVVILVYVLSVLYVVKQIEK